jgi:hypothetical protein
VRLSRHGWFRRLIRAFVSGRSVFELLAGYALILTALLLCEWWVASRWSCLLPGWRGELHEFLNDVAGFLLATQVGILAIVAVAVGIVTLIVQEGDGLAATSNVRLYYSECFAHELTNSGVALLFVLLAQLFWPLHHTIHALGVGTSDLIFKLTLTIIHAIWLALNVILFLYFIRASLDFVEPDARSRMRKQYTASIGIPGDLSGKLFDYFCRNAPAELLENGERTKGPTVKFGQVHFLPDDAVIEVSQRFAHPVVVRDVWLRLIAVPVRSWAKRSRRVRQGEDPVLVFPMGSGGAGEEELQILMRHGGASLNWVDRRLIRFGFRLSRPGIASPAIATPTEFLEGLVSSLVAKIEGGSFSAFRAKLAETIDYHRFALAALNSRDPTGEPINLAEIGGFWERPDQKWIHEYRRAFEATARKSLTSIRNSPSG